MAAVENGDHRENQTKQADSQTTDSESEPRSSSSSSTTTTRPTDQTMSSEPQQGTSKGIDFSEDKEVVDETQESNIAIIIKHAGAEYKIENLMLDHSIIYVKEQIFELTNVEPIRQKLLGMKPKQGTALSDEMTLDETNISDGMKIMMMGSQEKDIQSIQRRANLPQLEDDFDDYDPQDSDDLDSRIPRDPEYRAKVMRRVKCYKINMLNLPRPNKKLLVLDIDYTLFDHRSTAQTGSELMRPYLHEFLTSAYRDYDIVIWSATNMKYIEAKMREMRVVSNPNYKIVFYLDSAAMITVQSQKHGMCNVKPLGVIWGKFPHQYTPKNTIMFDDIRRNFLMNPQNGLKIKAFREAFKNRDTDQELLHLSKYLAKIAHMDDLSHLDHRHWQKMVDGSSSKKSKSSKR